MSDKISAEQFFTDGEYIFELKNDERRYFGLEEIKNEYEVETMFSKLCTIRGDSILKRTTIFFEGNIIKKVIYEERLISSKYGISDDTVYDNRYKEFDTNLLTENRQYILPLTDKGKPKKLTSTNIMAVDPFGCVFDFYEISRQGNESGLFVGNYRNNQKLPVEGFEKIKNNEDFREWIEWFISSCPDNYFEKVERVRTMKHRTVKFGSGDIFRMEYDRGNYCYGLILGKIRKIQKWKECLENHSFKWIMGQPILVRLYDLITPRADLTAEQLEEYELLPVQICVDNEIIWGTHPIVAHKKLEENDIDFKLSFRRKNDSDEYTYTFEWGMCQTTLKLTDEQLELHNQYVKGIIWDDHITGLRILTNDIECKAETGTPYSISSVWHEKNRIARRFWFGLLNLSEDADFDEFNKKYGGMTRSEIIKRLN